jgi:hypothetical protein
MMRSMSATPTPNAFLGRLPSDRRRELEPVLAVVRKHMPDGYRETIASGMIVFAVPQARYPDTYNGQPLWYVALAAQKNHLSLHLMAVYGSAELLQKLRDGFKAAGKKLDMGKACVRFRRADDLPLPVIAEIVASVPLPRFVATAQAARKTPARK